MVQGSINKQKGIVISEEQIGNILAFIIPFFPVLFIYSTGISSISLADALLIIWILLRIFTIRSIRLYINEFSALSYGIVFFMIFLFIYELGKGYGNDILLKFVRYFLYFLTAIIICPMCNRYRLAKRIYKVLAIVASSILLIQYAAYYVAGIKISGYIPFLPRMVTNDWQTMQNLSQAVSVYRPCSFFAEPAHFGAYVAGYLGIALWDNEESNVVRLFLTLALMLSTSSTAIVCAVFLWMIWILKRNKFSWKNFALVLVLLVGIFFIIRSTSFQYMINRIFVTGKGVEGRLGSFELLFKDFEANYLSYVFGHGFTYELMFDYLPGWGAFFYNFGIVGTLTFILFLILGLNKINCERRVLLAILSILSFGTLALVSYNVMLYVGLAYMGVSSSDKDIAIDNE